MAKSTFTKTATNNGSEDNRCITFVHHKGGTGKTTSCLNVAGWLARLNKKVLVVDLDPQGNATAGLGIDRKTLDSSIYDVFFSGKEIEEIILETDSGIYLAPSSVDLLAAETHMAGKADNSFMLRESLSNVAEHFDYILVDVPPGSTLLMINGIAASENIIIPLDSGVFAYETMETLKTLITDLDEELDLEINVMMVIIKEFSNSFFRSGPPRAIKKLIKEFLSKNISTRVKICTVPFSLKVQKAQMKGMPVSHYAPFSNVGRIYKNIAKEIMNYK